MKCRTDIEQIICFLNVIRRNPGISINRAGGYAGLHQGKLYNSIMPRIAGLVTAKTHSPRKLTLNTRGLAWLGKAEEVLQEIEGSRKK